MTGKPFKLDDRLVHRCFYHPLNLLDKGSKIGSQEIVDSPVEYSNCTFQQETIQKHLIILVCINKSNAFVVIHLYDRHIYPRQHQKK